ncbi:hypothetical protein MRB53_021335 [Persea americana]|uniref:Uncharacterized protein n=1 Tax=Persea americana TaxID=3435 RepID=A0ACC2L427_PERAE|nr:hypothetical protein MRB53_021335 [Persea americana]
MIIGTDLYRILTDVVPFYVAVILAYGSVKWWKIFSHNQCSHCPLCRPSPPLPLHLHQLSLHRELKIHCSEHSSKDVLVVLTIWTKTSSRGCLEWTITLFSLSTLPNTLVMGIPLLKGMYYRSGKAGVQKSGKKARRGEYLYRENSDASVTHTDRFCVA